MRLCRRGRSGREAFQWQVQADGRKRTLQSSLFRGQVINGMCYNLGQRQAAAQVRERESLGRILQAKIEPIREDILERRDPLPGGITLVAGNGNQITGVGCQQVKRAGRFRIGT